MLVGIAVTEVALWGRRQQARASQQQGYLDGVLSTAGTVGAGCTSTGSLVDHVCAQIVDVLKIDGCRFDPGDGPVLGASTTTRPSATAATRSTSSGWDCPPTARSRSTCAAAGSCTAAFC